MTQGPVVVKKYGNRRLYDTNSSRYITLDDLAKMIRAGHDVQVVDAKTKADLTKTVLLQIISEQEKEHDLIPVSFLKKVIQHGDATLRESMQRYLSVSLDGFLQAQKEFEQRYQAFAGNFMNPMMWMPSMLNQQMPGGQVHPPGAPGADVPPAAPAPQPPPDEPAAPAQEPAAPSDEDQDAPAQSAASPDEIQQLKEQMAALQQMMAKLVK